MESNIASRLKEFIDSTGMNNSQFADMCGIPKPSLSQILSGRNKKVSNQLLELLHTAFPELNVLWLIFGEGDMRNVDKYEAAKSDAPESQFESDMHAVHCEEEAHYGNRDSEITFLPQDDADFAFKANHKGLTSTANPSNTTDFQSQTTHIRIQELQMQIEKLQEQISEIRQNPRKVASITVYYDDSTFETFRPDH